VQVRHEIAGWLRTSQVSLRDGVFGTHRLQQATLAIRAHVPIEVLSDTIQPFPSFSGIYNAALMALRMQIADMPPPVRPMAAQTASLSR
jgi:hypothetical protein